MLQRRTGGDTVASMRDMRLLAAVLAALVLGGCGAAPGPPAATPTAPPRFANDFGAFNFTIEDRSPAAQAELLAALGYRGIMFNYRADSFAAFASAPLRVMAVLIRVEAARAVDRGALLAAFDAVARAGGIPCVILEGPDGLSLGRLAAVTAELADLAARANGGQGVTIALYPHAGQPAPDVETALAVMQTAARPNVKLSMHLCHELRAGHQDRLAEVIALVAPHLALVSVNGADVEREPTPPRGDWHHTIRPLYKGDYDVESLYLRPLVEAGYTGPVILHTFQLQEPPEEHYAGSLARWRQMMAALGLVP
jgi:sugar phosphate isomerase/epimerase